MRWKGGLDHWLSTKLQFGMNPYGIAESEEERAEVINEAKQILDVEDVISSILLVEDLRIVKN